MGALVSFFETSGVITLLVIFWLSLYVIATLWIFIYKWFVIRGIQDRETYSLDLLLSKDISIPQSAVFARSKGHRLLSKEMLQVWKSQILKNASGGLTFLSIVSSTAPFIGLFGTVTEILDAFAHLGCPYYFKGACGDCMGHFMCYSCVFFLSYIKTQDCCAWRMFASTN